MPQTNSAAQRYHDSTKHSVARLHSEPHFLDWDNKPLPFKVYPHLDRIALPRELAQSAVPALAALDGGDAGRPEPSGDLQSGAGSGVDLRQLARLLHFSAGITRKKTFADGQEYYFRAAACTGALYHIDLYVICAPLADLPAGVYQFAPHDFSLYRLRDGDYRAAVIAASGDEASIAGAPVVIACASTYWRNTWKYRARAYRHAFWDTGTILANLFAIAEADKVAVALVAGFVDRELERLLALDPEREGAIALVALGNSPPPLTAVPAVAPLSLETLPLSAEEIDYPLIRATHAASSFANPTEVRAWRAAAALRPASLQLAPPSGREIVELRPMPVDAIANESIEAVISRRGSTRRFGPRTLRFEELSTILVAGSHAPAADFPRPLNQAYLIVNAVDDLQAGTYVFHTAPRQLERLKAGDFRRQAGELGLGQDLPRDASVNIYFLCDLDAVIEQLGERGYRAAHLEAAIQAGKMYLAAYALRAGASGLTFFDDDVTRFFAPHADNKSVMFLLAIGHAHGRARSA